ncbi:MAG TPA: alpha/beta hydrolase [Conexibacter sp.]|nr:alpha/beta hydrolase [Conexibacter sp.]
MPHADCNGQRLYYEVHGEGEPLLCIHGLSVDTLGWALQVPAWSQQHRTIVFDNRDVGQSSRADGEYEIADMAADALALADTLELERFHLLGLSMGGTIAQELTLAAPERVQSLTLCVTFGGGGAWGRAQGTSWSKRVLSMSREERVEDLMLLCFSEAFYENAEQVAFLRQALLANPHPQEPEAFGRQLLATSRHEARDRLGALSLPVHVIGAEHDLLVPVWKSRELAELIPGARLTVLEAAAHGANLERAVDFNAAVTDFLAALDAAVR